MAYPIDLSAEVALVTGGSRNIGLAVAKALRAAGARVCIWGGSDRAALEAALVALGDDAGAAMGGLVKVEDENSVVAGYDEIEAQFGPVSILVNSAAVRPYDPLVTMSRAIWTQTVDVILTGAFLTSRELVRRLPRERNGAIVNLGGISAHRPAKDRAHVIAAKTGLIGLTRALAEEGLGRIRANCVVPGAIDTERNVSQIRPRFADDRGYALGRPADVANAVLPLADPSEQYVTGQTVHVSGGRFMP
ncbi:SDR family NAD(P)-dependent oxidoreductase [Candidatus Rariloculus sp.]|uniref:SDR family NAD(P)-dependent oxidoreductase n=1 Tax=Candidatus Rariloculus sp. TaxID=3101265 RepID=UPI003D0A0F48